MRTVLALALIACKGPTPDPEVETDADTDADADTDTDADADTDSDADTDTDVLPTEVFTDGTWSTTVTVADEPTLARTYTFDTDHPQRDGGPSTVVVVESPDQPVLRSGSLIFDGLFALAVQEARQNSVSTVSDGAFANGAPVACECFQTGELWSWVWTRDTAYAADLGLAWLDPDRTASSLRFKLSAPKSGGALRIVQDTGSGGSWPVSTDRAIWALGASAVLDTLEGAARDAFLDDALEAVTTTAQEDRTYVWDASDGLYRGEQSFLDWREQSYPSWTADDVVAIAEGKALSTNLAHWVLLDAAARWSDERGLAADRDLYRGWADDLEAAIQATFWQGDRWATLVGPALDPSVQGRRDLLGEALAALTIAPGQDALSTYPHGPHGAPVMWPQQAGVRIYHNRALWPFVTAYGVRAASRAHNAPVFDAGAAELIRSAAINLSNMENAEWISGDPGLDDQSGPAVDSRRQLWSVAGYLSLVVDGLFGVRPGPAGLAFEPFVTDAVRTEWLDDTVTLHRFPWHGDTVDLVLELPAGPGPFGPGTVTPTATGFTIAPVPVASQGSRTDVDPAVPAAHTAPPEPVLDAPTGGASGVTLTWASAPGAVYDVVRDGTTVATGVTSPWTDADTAGIDDVSWCYALRARWPAGPEAAPSRAQCWWGAANDRVQTFDAYHFESDGTWSELHGRPHHQDWGAPSHTLRMRFRPAWSGPQGLQLEYANGGPIQTGITASHKWFQVLDGVALVAEGPIVLPHTGGWDVWKDSSLAWMDLDADTTYTLAVGDAPNMTDLEAMRDYTAGPGGGPDPFRFVDIAAVKLLAFDGIDQRAPANALGFDGADDLAAFPVGQDTVPGAPLQAWDAFAMEWDDDFLYVALVSEAFEDPFVPFVLYVEADPTGTAAVGAGFEYSGQTPALPFTPTHAVAVRRQHDAADGFGPWSGVWRAGAGWQLVQRFVEGRDVWVAADQHTVAVRIPRVQLGDPTSVRLAGHVVYAQPANEWKDTVPSGHTPWDPSGGTAWTVDLAGAHGAAAWVEQ